MVVIKQNIHRVIKIYGLSPSWFLTERPQCLEHPSVMILLMAVLINFGIEKPSVQCDACTILQFKHLIEDFPLSLQKDNEKLKGIRTYLLTDHCCCISFYQWHSSLWHSVRRAWICWLPPGPKAARCSQKDLYHRPWSVLYQTRSPSFRGKYLCFTFSMLSGGPLII